MTIRHILYVGTVVSLFAVLSGCGSKNSEVKTPVRSAADYSHTSGFNEPIVGPPESKSTIWDLFSNSTDPNREIQVNKYIWKASLEVLDFLPIQSVDPFSGVIVTGYGTPPGGGRSYRATVHITDPSLDARSLKVAIESKSGTVSPDTVRAIEDAILTRARQLRLADSQL